MILDRYKFYDSCRYKHGCWSSSKILSLAKSVSLGKYYEISRYFASSCQGFFSRTQSKTRLYHNYTESRSKNWGKWSENSKGW